MCIHGLVSLRCLSRLCQLDFPCVKSLVQLEMGFLSPLGHLDHKGNFCHDYKQSKVLLVHKCLCVCISVCIHIYCLTCPLHPKCSWSLNSVITTREWFIATSWVDAISERIGFFLPIACWRGKHRGFSH